MLKVYIRELWRSVHTMKRYRSAQYMLLVLVGLLAVLAAQAGATALGNDSVSLAAATHLSAEHQVRTAWQKAQQIGIYHYNTTLVQTTWPQPKLENVGLSSRQERIYLEGQANLPEEQLSLKPEFRTLTTG